MMLVVCALLLGAVAETKSVETDGFGIQPCMDLTDNCVPLIAKGICESKTSYLCALSCRQCLPPADNVNYQPNRNIVAVDTKNPPDHNWPSPFPPDVKPTPESDSHRKKRQIPDPFKKEHETDHPEDNYPRPDFDPEDIYPRPDFASKKFSTNPDGYDVSHQLPNDPLNPRTYYPPRDDESQRRRRSAPIPPPIHDPDLEGPRVRRHQDSSLPIMPPEDNIPFPHTEDDTFVYPPLDSVKTNSKLLRRHKRQMEHPLKKDQRPPRDPKDPFPFDHKDPGDHFPHPIANDEQIYPMPVSEPNKFPHRGTDGQDPDKVNVPRDPTNLSPGRQVKPIPYPLHPDDDSPFPWDPVDHVPNHIPIPGAPNNPLNQSPDDQIPEVPDQDLNDPFLYPHRDPTEYRPFPHSNPRDQLPIPHYDPRDQLPRPHQNPGEVGDKLPKDDGKLSKEDGNSKKPQGMRSPSPDSDIFKLSGPLTPADYEYSNQKDFNPYSPDLSSSEEVDPFYQNLPPRHTGPNHQIPSNSRHHKGRKPRHGGKDKKRGKDQSKDGVKNGDSQLEQTPESASVFPLPGDALNRKKQVDEIPGTITDITDHQMLDDPKKSGDAHRRKKRQTNDEGIHVLYDDPFAAPDGHDPTEVEHQLDEPLKKDQFPFPDKKSDASKRQLDEPLKKDQFPYPSKKLHGSKPPGDTSHLPESDSRTPIGSKLDDQWQEGTFPLPDPIDIDRQTSDPHESGHSGPAKKDQYPFPDNKIDLQSSVHQKQFMNPYGMGGISGLGYGGIGNGIGNGIGGFGYGGIGTGIGSMGGFGAGMSPMSALNAQYATIWCQINPATGQPLNLQFCNYYTAMSRTPYGVLQGGTKQPNTEGGEAGRGQRKLPKKDSAKVDGKPGQVTSGTGHNLKNSGDATKPKNKLFHGDKDPSNNEQTKPDQFNNNWGHMSDIPRTLPDGSNSLEQRGDDSRSSEQSFDYYKNLPDPVMRQFPSPDEIKDPKEGPNSFRVHPKNIKLSGNQDPNEQIPVPDEVPRVESQSRRIKKQEEHHFPRPTPARPLPDNDDFNPFDQFD